MEDVMISYPQGKKTRFGILKIGCFLALLTCRASQALADNVFVTDVGNNFTNGAIYEVNTAGGPGQSLGTPLVTGMGGPASLSLDNNGNLFAYGGDGNGNGNIYEFNPANGYRQTPGSPLVIGQYIVYGMANHQGNLFAAIGPSVYEFNPANGNGQRPGNPYNSSIGPFNSPVGPFLGLAFDSHGNLFASGIGTLYEIAPNGTTSIFSQEGIIPYSIAFDNNGDLFGAVPSGGIYEYANVGGILSPNAVLWANIKGVEGIAFDSAGNLLATDNNNNSILEFNQQGESTVLASGGTNLWAIVIEPSPVPEPSASVLLWVASAFLLIVHFRSCDKRQAF
jgi:hypothetical protein